MHFSPWFFILLAPLLTLLGESVVRRLETLDARSRAVLPELPYALGFGEYLLSGVLTALCVGLLQLAQLPLHLVHSLAAFSAAAVALLLVDARYQYLPDVLTLPLAGAGLLLSSQGLGVVDLQDAVIGLVLLFGLFALLEQGYWLVTGQMGVGGGDVRFAGALGVWFGALDGSLILAGACGLAVAAQLVRKLWRPSKTAGLFAFGPWMVLSAWGFLGWQMFLA